MNFIIVFDLKDFKLADKLTKWEKYYNYHRSHSPLQGMARFEKYWELKNIIPTIAEIHVNYDKTKETTAIWDYKDDQQFKAVYKFRNKYW